MLKKMIFGFGISMKNIFFSSIANSICYVKQKKKKRNEKNSSDRTSEAEFFLKVE